ncbi:MAG: hypothetical protein RLZZ453_1080 [Chlamydiota bacterium]
MSFNRCKILYLGTDPKFFVSPIEGAEIVHCPLIKTVVRSKEQVEAKYRQLEVSSHVIFTSKNAVSAFFFHLKTLNREVPKDKVWICIGPVTALHLKQEGIEPTFLSEVATQEGVVALLKSIPCRSLFIPKSSLSRSLLFDWLDSKNIPYTAIDVYDTYTQYPHLLPNLDEFALVVFTSPSTVTAFKEVFGKLPQKEKCYPIGPITEAALFC